MGALPYKIKGNFNRREPYRQKRMTQAASLRCSPFFILRSIIKALYFYYRANKVFDLVVNTLEKNRNLTRRCSKFVELEQILGKLITKI